MKNLKNIIIIGSIALVAIVFASMYISTSNKEITLRTRIEAQNKKCEVNYDKMWKIISQTAQVADEYKNTFKEVYPDIIEGRYGNENGGTLMKWIKEANPVFDVTLFRDLNRQIEAQRTGFAYEQELLVDLDAQHKLLRRTFPNSLIVGNRPDVRLTIITSSRTNRAVESGVDDEVELFKKQ